MKNGTRLFVMMRKPAQYTEQKMNSSEIVISNFTLKIFQSIWKRVNIFSLKYQQVKGKLFNTENS